MPRQTYTIAGRTFTRKSDLQDYIRAIVARYGDDVPLGIGDAEFMSALLENHPLADAKIGAGVASIVVRRNPQYPSTRGFYLHRVDGSSTDFSWTECIRPTPHHKKVLAALRVVVKPQTMAFKRAFFDAGGNRCELTGEAIEFVGSHVDHVPPLTFNRLVEQFCYEYGFDLDKLPLRDEAANNKYADVIDDDIVTVGFAEYHRQFAKLRVVSRLGNLSHAKKGSAA